MAPLTILAGCTGALGTSDYAVVDSADVQVVTSLAPAWGSGSGWIIDTVPYLSIGEADGDLAYVFGRVGTAAWLADGRIVVSEESDRRIRVYGADGVHLGDVGRVGDGPGEFQSLWTLGAYRGDSLYASDFQTGRISIWGPDLAYGRGFTVDSQKDYYRVSDPLPDGRFVLHRSGNPTFSAGRGVHPDTSLILVASPVGATLDTLGAFVVRRVFVGDEGLTWNFHLAPYGHVRADSARVVWHEGARVEYWQVDHAGASRRVVRAPHKAQAVSARLIADYKMAYLDLLSGMRNPRELEYIAATLDEGTYHDTRPAVSDLKLDPDGNTWLGRHSLLPGMSTQWEVFDPRGVWLGNVATPRGLAVTAIGRTAVLGSHEDETGVVTVRLHRITKP